MISQAQGNSGCVKYKMMSMELIKGSLHRMNYVTQVQKKLYALLSRPVENKIIMMWESFRKLYCLCVCLNVIPSS